MDGTMIAIYMGTVIFALILLFWFVGTWNRLVRLEKDVDRAWSNIDTILQQRFDMIPNMVKIVQEYAGHEKEIFGDLSEARKTFAAASKGGDVSGVMAAESMLSQSMPKLLALSEAYPALGLWGVQPTVTPRAVSASLSRELYVERLKGNSRSCGGVTLAKKLRR